MQIVSKVGISESKTKVEKEASRPKSSREWEWRWSPDFRSALTVCILSWGLSQNHLEQPLSENIDSRTPTYTPFAVLIAGRRPQPG